MKPWRLYKGLLILTCFTGEKFVTGQQRFAPWYVYHKGGATPPVTKFSRPAVLPRTRPAALRRLPDTACIAPHGAPNRSRAQTHETGQYQRPLV